MPSVAHSDSVEYPSQHHGDPDQHTLNGMYGLLTAITVTGPMPRAESWRPTQRLKLFIQSDSTATEASRRFGIEIDSYYDGAVGWSGVRGTNGRTQPAVRPGRTFEVRLTPQRAGTFMYHTHLDEIRQ